MNYSNHWHVKILFVLISDSSVYALSVYVCICMCMYVCVCSLYVCMYICTHIWQQCCLCVNCVCTVL